VALFFAVAPALAEASTYYLSGSGSNSNAGTLSRPWRTIEHADEVVKAGDTVYLRSGSYGARATKTVIDASGTAAARISWLGYPGDARPTVLGQLQITGPHNRVSGLLFDGPTGSLPGAGEDVVVWLNAAGEEFNDNEVREGAGHAGIFVSDASNFSITDNYIYSNGVTYNLDHGIYVSSGSGLIDNNVITENFAWGVQLYPDASGVTVSNNTIVGNGRGGIVVGIDSANNVLTDNIVVDNGEYGIYAYNLVGRGNVATDNLLWDQDLDTTGAGMLFDDNVIADPQFLSESDFRLENGSPAIGKGVSEDVAETASGGSPSAPDPPAPPVVEPTPPPVVEPTPPVVEPTPPVVEPTPPIVEPTPPVTEPDPPVVVEPTPPVVEPTPPVVEPTPPVVEPDPPVTKPTPPPNSGDGEASPRPRRWGSSWWWRRSHRNH
jgi:parallel beta-helix repeat protein